MKTGKDMNMLFIGVDLGTSAVKLLLMDENGKIKKTVSREYPLYFPHPGWSEQKPEDWYIQSMDGLKELLKDEKKEEVAGISFGGQMHGLVILDENDNVIRPAILWCFWTKTMKLSVPLFCGMTAGPMKNAII